LIIYITISADNKSKIADNIKISKQTWYFARKTLKTCRCYLHTITKIESGVNEKSIIETLFKITKALGVSVDNLIK